MFFAFRQIMRKTKLYISGGGTLMQNATSNRSLRYYLMSIRMAHAAGNKVMLYGCGIGPIRGAGSRRRTARVLDRCADLITLRDDNIAARSWRRIGVSKPEMAYHSRPGAAASTRRRRRRCRGSSARLGLEEGRHYAMFVLRPWQNFSAHVQDFAQAAQWLYDMQGLVPVFFAMEPARDLRAMDQVIAQLHCPSLRLCPPDTDAKMIGLFRRMDIVISMRLHALVFAAGQGVPLLGIVYDPKVDGFLEYLGQRNYLALQQVSPAALREAIAGTLRSGVPDQASVARLQQLAAENEKYLRKVLQEL